LKRFSKHKFGGAGFELKNMRRSIAFSNYRHLLWLIWRRNDWRCTQKPLPISIPQSKN